MAKQVPPVDVAWVQRLLDSHALWLNQELIDLSGDIGAQSERLFLAPFVVDEDGNRLGQAVAFSDWTPLVPLRHAGTGL